MRRPAGIVRAIGDTVIASALALPIGLLAGSASALFLQLLDRTTGIHRANPWLLYLLPLAGLSIVWLYRKIGGASERGNDLILERMHAPGEGVPRRMAPLVLAGAS